MKFKLKPDYQDRQLAFAIWAELATREASLPFDPDHDILSELYASWYEFFGRTRDLIKTLPLSGLTGNQRATSSRRRSAC